MVRQQLQNHIINSNNINNSNANLRNLLQGAPGQQVRFIQQPQQQQIAPNQQLGNPQMNQPPPQQQQQWNSTM